MAAFYEGFFLKKNQIDVLYNFSRIKQICFFKCYV